MIILGRSIGSQYPVFILSSSEIVHMLPGSSGCVDMCVHTGLLVLPMKCGEQPGQETLV